MGLTSRSVRCDLGDLAITDAYPGYQTVWSLTFPCQPAHLYLSISFQRQFQ